MENRRITILGIDGGTFEILLPFAEIGIMPNLARLIKRGTRAELISTFSFLTAPAWTSFMTGKNPGKHDVFDFVRPYRKDVSVQFNNYRSIRSRTIWDILSEKGYRVCALNVPMTYPAPSLNGICISGLGTPGLNERAFHPRELYRELQEELGPYILDVPLEKYGPQDAGTFLDELIECTEVRRRYLLHLFEREQWDLFMAVITGTDRIQHKLWDILAQMAAGSTNGDGGELEDRIRRYFLLVDDIIGEMDRRIGKNDLFLMMSDHGFGSLDHELTINRWLADRGYFAPLRGRIFLKGIMRTARSTQMRILSKFFPKALERNSRKRMQETETTRKPRIEFIDWENTRAFSSTRTQQGITINVKGREPHGTVSPGEEYEKLRDQVISELRDLADPVTGQKMENLVFRREEVYRGPYVENAPDIVYLFDGGRIIATHQYKSSMFTPTDWKLGNGMHRREGIFLACGSSVKEGEILGSCDITDVTPTALYYLGVEIPDDMDGHIIERMYKQDFISRNTVRFEESVSAQTAGDDGVYSEEDRKTIEQQLRGIGYLE